MSVRTPLSNLNCSLAKTADIIGDGWAMLILRDLFLGADRFQDMAASTGMARNILSDLLSRLVASGLVMREGTKTRPIYRLSDKGLDLIPAMIALMQWGDRWLAQNQPPILLTDHKGRKLPPVELLSKRGKPIDPRKVRARPGPGAEEPTGQWLLGLQARKT